MSVKLRLKRFGRRHLPVYRLGAVDARRPRDGRVLETLGTYDPTNKDEQKQVVINKERVQHWLSVGATPSETVASILKRSGVQLPKRPKKSSKSKASQTGGQD